MSKVIAFLYKHGKAMTSAVMLVTLGVTMMAGALLSYKSAEAATLTSVSDLVSESAPSSASNHTITFTAATAVANGGKVKVTFDSDFTGAGSLVEDDFDFSVTASALSTAANCAGSEKVGVSVAGSVATFELCSGDGASLANGNVVTILVGKNAVYSGTGANQLSNPALPQNSHSIYIQTTTSGDVLIDDATTYVAIVPTVELTAEVAPYFFFRVEGESTSVGSGAYDTFAISSTSQDGWANFGVLTANTPVTMASSLSARTNATNGFVVTLQQNHNMLASSSADIDCFSNGITACDTTYSTWSSPTGTLGDEKTYGHLGIHPTTNNDAGIASTQWFGLENTDLKTIWSQPGAADGATMDVGVAKVLYRVEVSALQEVGRYENRLMYIGTATF